MVSCDIIYCLESRSTEENLLDKLDSNIDSTEYKVGTLAIT